MSVEVKINLRKIYFVYGRYLRIKGFSNVVTLTS